MRNILQYNELIDGFMEMVPVEELNHQYELMRTKIPEILPSRSPEHQEKVRKLAKRLKNQTYSLEVLTDLKCRKISLILIKNS
jgi:hypothetical protein